MIINKIYYMLKPAIPRRVQLSIRRKIIERKMPYVNNVWPININAGKCPADWPGWPDGKKFALILTHDVESDRGQNKCLQLAEIEQCFDLRSSFNFVPERYQVSSEIRQSLCENGFEVGVHDFNHDGKLFNSYSLFSKRAKLINRYIADWNASGFRAGAMRHNLDWISELKIQYDCSTFDTDPFEPQPDGMETIFPFWVKNKNHSGGYLEMPYTLPQDFLLFIMLREQTIDIWKRKLDWIVENGGMALVNTHPDYMNLANGPLGIEEYPGLLYKEFLRYVCTRYEGQFFHVIPKALALLYCKVELPIK